MRPFCTLADLYAASLTLAHIWDRGCFPADGSFLSPYPVHLPYSIRLDQSWRLKVNNALDKKKSGLRQLLFVKRVAGSKGTQLQFHTVKVNWHSVGLAFQFVKIHSQGYCLEFSILLLLTINNNNINYYFKYYFTLVISRFNSEEPLLYS